MKVDKTLIASVGLHVLVIGWGLVSFSARSLEAMPPESMPVDIISADQLSKITAGQLVLNKRPTDLNALIEHNLSLNRILAERRQVHLDYKSTAKFSNVLLDARKIEQVLNNLIDNAVKASPPEGTVAVQLLRDDDSALLRVTDQGPGIPVEELAVIFQPFRQGQLGTDKEGKSAGLGLAIANSIVRGHGGCLWADSVPPNGASFFVLLPVSGTLT